MLTLLSLLWVTTTTTTMHELSWIPLIRFRDEVNHTHIHTHTQSARERWLLHLQHLRLWAKSDLQERTLQEFETKNHFGRRNSHKS